MEQVQAVASEQQRRCDELILQARKEADEQRSRMIAKSRDAVREMETHWQQDLERERTTFLKELRRRTATEILSVARQDLASRDLQSSAVEVFLEKLRSFDATTLRQMGDSELVVRSPAELPKEGQEEIRAILAERMGAPPHLQFVRDAALAWGIELRGNGLKIGWSPESYLDAIEEKLKAELDRAPAALSHVAAD
jgi:F-type H+-transporting ATPase subunit b